MSEPEEPTLVTTGSAVDAALAVAREHGLEVGSARLLSETNNVLVDLAPSPLVARVAMTIGRVRPDGGGVHLRREVEVAGFLAARGGPVIAPSPLLPALVHERGAHRISFWERADGQCGAGFEEGAAALVELHALLAGYEGELEPLSPVLGEVEAMLVTAEAEGGIDAAAAGTVRGGLETLREELAAAELTVRPVHGDAHRDNLLRIGGRLAWTDFEDVCLAPLEWDVACLVGGFEEPSEELLAPFGGEVDLAAVELMSRARLIQAAAWTALLTIDDPARAGMRDHFVARVAAGEGRAPSGPSSQPLH